MPSRFDPPPSPPGAGSQEDGVEKIDTSKRYDVYCLEHGVRTVVHRGVLFKGVRALFGQEDRLAKFDQYIELELPSGHAIFVHRNWILRFCEHGVEIPIEVVSPQ